MDYRHIDWAADRPDPAAVAGDWDRTVVTAIAALDPRLTRVADALRITHVNGGVQLAQCRIEAPPAISWVLARNRWNEFDLLGRFFRHSAVRDALPAVATIRHSIDAFQMEGSFTAYGRLAHCIASGGAYRRFAGSDDDVLHLVSDFMRAAFDLRLSEISTWVNWTPWTAWFQDIAWDATFLWFDTRTGIVTILLITDTD